MKIINKIYNIDNSINKTIVLISDIHYQDKTDIKHLDKVLDNIKKINPDFICIPGDIVNNVNIKDESSLITWFKKISKISKVIISIGNHEYYIDKKKKLFGFSKELFDDIKSINNIYVLDNDNIVIDDINFIGLTLSKEHYFEHKEREKDFDKYLKNIKPNKKYYNVLLCHSPLNIINSKVDVDLILCGHTHGGMIPNIFRYFIKHAGLLSPTKRPFPKYTYGKIKKNGTTIITTRGICVLPRKLGRLINLYSGEVVKIKISNN